MIFESLWLWSLLLATLGVVGVSWGLWGRRERPKDHPGWCRRCRYPANDGVAQCPECGADLTRPKSIRPTFSRPVWGGVILSGLLLITGLLGLGVHAYFKVSKSNPRSAMPLWMLSFEADGHDAGAAKARAEILARYEIGSLTNSQTLACVERAMRRVQTLSRAWNEQDAMLIESAWLAGDVSDERMNTFIDAAWDRYCTPQIRTVCREGRWIPYRLVLPQFKTRLYNVEHQRSSIRIVYHGLGPDIEIYKLLKPLGTTSPGWSLMGIGMTGGGPSAGTQLTPGEHDIWLDVEFAWLIDDVPRLTWRRRYHERVTILPKDAEQTLAVPDESKRQAIRDAALLEFQYARFEFQPGSYFDLGSHTGFVGLRQVPTPVAFDVFYRFGSRELHAGTLRRLPTDAPVLMPMSTVGGYILLNKRLPAGTTSIDVILRPNPLLMDGIVEVVPEIWGGEIVFENVPVSLEPLDRKR